MRRGGKGKKERNKDKKLKENLKIIFLNLKIILTNKNISRDLFGAVVGCVESVQCQLFSCSSLLSKSTVATQMQSQLNCRILICCTCHFWGSSPFFFFFCLGSPPLLASLFSD